MGVAECIKVMVEGRDRGRENVTGVVARGGKEGKQQKHSYVSLGEQKILSLNASRSFLTRCDNQDQKGIDAMKSSHRTLIK